MKALRVKYCQHDKIKKDPLGGTRINYGGVQQTELQPNWET